MKPMGTIDNINCCVYGCHSKRSKNRCLSFHGFPKSGERKVVIVNELGLSELIDTRKAWILKIRTGKAVTKYMKICSLHFKTDDFILPDVPSKRKVLKRDAVPSQNLPVGSIPKTKTAKNRSSRRDAISNLGDSKMSKKSQGNIKDRPSITKNIYCAAKVCSNDLSNRPYLKFFSFPTDEKLATIWATNAQRIDLIPISNFLSNYYLCADHFDDQYFEDVTRTNLKENVESVPTIFKNNLKNIITSESKIHLIDHNYIRDSSCNGNITEVIKDNVDNEITTNEEKQDTELYIGKEKYYCRLCATIFPITSLLSISKNENNFIDMLNMCLPGKFQKDDNLPKNICSICKNKLENCCTVLKGFITADIRLRKIFNNKNQSNIKEIKNNKKTEIINPPIETISLSDKKSNIKIHSKDKICSSEFKSNEKDIKSEENPEEKESTNIEVPKLVQLEENLSETTSMIKYQCLICSRLFESKKEVIDHSQELHSQQKQEKILCRVVRVTNEKKIYDNIAKRRKNQSVKYECITCGSLFNAKENVILHSLKVHSTKGKIICKIVKPDNINQQKLLKCVRCSETFATFRTYKKHLRNHVKFLCEDCGQGFLTITILKKHRLKTHRLNNVRCMKYKEEFDTEEELVKHCDVQKNHSKSPQEFDCNTCNKKFKTVLLLRRHLRSHVNPLCNICGKLFSTKGHLKEHLATHSTERPFSCHICQKTFKTKTSLQIHIKTHNTERKYICQFCGKQFRTRQVFTQHLRIHNRTKSFPCEICQKKFASSVLLQNHLLTHSEARPYACQICPKTFKTSVNLSKHKFIHEPEKRFECPVCKKKFRSPKFVNAHKKIHLRAELFTCGICSCEFKRHGNFKKHVEAHKKGLIQKEDKLYNCQICNKKFLFEYSLFRHRKYIHHEEKPYICLFCGENFANRPKLLIHKRIHAKNEANSKETFFNKRGCDL